MGEYETPTLPGPPAELTEALEDPILEHREV